jgi:hypothetical protein
LWKQRWPERLPCHDCRLTWAARRDLRALCPEGGLSDAARDDTDDASVLT